MLVAQPRDLANAFGWKVTDARSALQSLESAGEALRDGSTYRGQIDSRKART